MDKHYFNIKESDTEAVIEVYGTIGESWWDEGVTFQSVSEQLKEIANTNKKVLVKINSYGGDVNDALAIFEILHGMGDRVTTECVGFCASAATIIAMAGTVRRMSSYGLFLVHKCSSWASGNENDLEAELEAQRKVNDRIVALYHDVTGCDREKLEALMNEDNGNGIWLNVDEAMEYGFITEAIKDTKEDTKKKAIVMSMFKKLFTNKKDTPQSRGVI
jgi:ATP-dependent protease ClpP protease subunit